MPLQCDALGLIHPSIRREVLAEVLCGAHSGGVFLELSPVALDLCRELLATNDELRCLILTSFTDEQSMLDAIVAGASGYVVKDIRGMELAEAIKAVGSGKSLLDNRAAEVLMSRLRRDTEQDERLRDLSPTERTLLQLLGEGLTNREIGQRMFLAEKTVKNYVSRLLTKLGLSGRTQAALFAAETMRRSDG